MTFQVAVLVIGITERKISQIRIIIGGAFCGSVVRNSAFTGSFAGSCALGGCFAGGCAGTAGSQAKNHAACQQAGSSAGSGWCFSWVVSCPFLKKIHRVPQQGKNTPVKKRIHFLIIQLFCKKYSPAFTKGKRVCYNTRGRAPNALPWAADLLPGYPYIRKGTEPYGKRKNRAHQCAGS